MQICRKIWISVVLCFVLVVMIGLVGVIGSRKHSRPVAEASPQLQQLAQMPMTFVENQGQWPEEVAYLARKGAMTAWLQKDGITFRFTKGSNGDQNQSAVIQITFENASAQVSVEGRDKQPSKHNFFVGNDRTQWRSGVSSYAKVIYKNLYDDINVCVREHNGWIEYDLLLSQGADLHDVVICCDGLKDLHVGDDGILVMETEFGPVTQKLPTAWYELPLGDRLPVTCNFRKIDDQRYGFEVENDLGLALVVDPGLEWSTFLGGGGFDRAICVGLQALGGVIVSGETQSMDFPVTSGAIDTTINGHSDIFVSCLSSNGDYLDWSTFLGGSGRDEPFDLAVDATSRPTIVGVTMSPDFPTTASAFDTTFDGALDAVIAHLSMNGDVLMYSSYLGGSGEDWICTIEHNEAGEAYVGGYTSSVDFPTTSNSYDTTHNGARDAFVTKVNTSGSNLLYSTFLGGSGNEGWYYDTTLFLTREMALACDISGEVVVAGMTGSPDFPTSPEAYDTSFNGGWDIFVSRFNAAGSNLIYSTFFGGNSTDFAYSKDIVLSPSGIVTIAGATVSNDFPTTPGAYDIAYNGGYDAFVARFNDGATTLLYSTYLGGPGADGIQSIVTDIQGKIVTVGVCEVGMPFTSGAFDTTFNGLQDVFINRMSLDGNGLADLVYSTYLGGETYDWATAVVKWSDSAIVVSGQAGVGFPTTPGAFDTSFNYGGQDGFVCRFSPYVGIEENKTKELISTLVLSTIFPNPSYREFNYSVNLQSSQNVQVSVFDIAGRLVEKLIDGQLHAGIHEFSWLPGDNIASGTYFVTLRTGDLSETRKVLLVK